jgi:hypothetical protein
MVASEMTREIFTDIAPIICFAALLIPNQSVMLAVLCFVAGAAVACRFSIDAANTNPELSDASNAETEL